MKKRRSLFQRIFLPLLLVASLQTILLYGVLQAGGVFAGQKQNALELLREQAANTFTPLSSNMTSRWTNTTSTEEELLQRTQSILAEENKTFTDLRSDPQLCARILEEAVPELIVRLRTNQTTGIFLVFCDETEQDPTSRTGICLRTASPDRPASGNSDLQMVRGLPSIARDQNLSLSSFWQADYKITENESDWYTRPLAVAESTTLRKNAYGAYWCPPFRLNGDSDIETFTWSIPLLDPDGIPYAVLGVELNTNHVSTLLRSQWRGEQADFFFILGMEQDGTLTPMLTSGSRYKKYYKSSTDSIQITPEKGHVSFNGLYTLDHELDSIEKIHGVLLELPIYPNNSPYADEHWVLVTAEGERTLYHMADTFSRLVGIALFVTLLLGILLSLLASHSIVRPITTLVRILNTDGGRKRLVFPNSGIREIDALSNAITSMTDEITQNSKRTAQLIELSGLPVGVFEIRSEPPTAYCSDGFYKLAGREDLIGKQEELTLGSLQEMIDALQKEQIEPDIYRQNEVPPRYLRIVTQKEGSDLIGSVMDITEEIEEKQRMEYERDFDALTGIYNRRAFETRMELLFSVHAEEIQTGAMIMMDLDNLKFLNDTYGHDCGDQYIRAFADALHVFTEKPNIIARRSGDEFYAFLYGFANKAEAMKYITQGWEKITHKTLLLPDSTNFRMRVSGGISWYPMDAQEPDKLIHYADFAMYWVKHTHKGDLDQFRMSDYNASSYLVNGQDALNRLIDDQLVHFAFQPILRTKDGSTAGYEILMRSDLEEFRSPEVILRLAKSQGKLHYIEWLTWAKGLKDVKQFMDNGQLKKTDLIFLNSIANQTMFPSEQQTILKNYGSLLSNVVMEITEGEDNNKEFTKHKLDFIRSHGGGVAIDDFGTGYNSELALISIPADIVKLDISFVRNVDQDVDKQMLIKNLIRFARQRSIAVLAEGVETEEEMKTLLDFGVDYMQGYYFARPMDVPKPARGEAVDKLKSYSR